MVLAVVMRANALAQQQTVLTNVIAGTVANPGTNTSE
jgi:hypothetical protein